MTDSIGFTNIEFSNSSLYDLLKNCAKNQSCENLPIDDYSDVCLLSHYYKMISTNTYSISGNILTSSFASDESFSGTVLEEDGRISLAYENLRTIPRSFAEKFAAQTKFLDLSYNNFRNLSFLSFFEDLHTLILDRNSNLDVNTLPFLPSLKILWINNCDITNVTDWVHRIQKHCPALEHLSIMGNPGIHKLFSDISPLPTVRDSFVSLPYAADYREYILHVLPNLQNLDGVPRSPQALLRTVKKNGTMMTSTSTDGKLTTSNGNSASDYKHHRSPLHSPTLSFKDLFRLKRRKRSYQSSSTN